MSWATETGRGSHAGLGRSVRRRGGCGLRQRSACRRKNPLGANLDHDQLHDDLQCAGRDVPSGLFRTAGADGWYDNDGDRTGPEPRSQCDGEHVVRHELHDDTAHMSDDLRQNIALAVTGQASNCRD
jgi:hypothetical protein